MDSVDHSRCRTPWKEGVHEVPDREISQRKDCFREELREEIYGKQIDSLDSLATADLNRISATTSDRVAKDVEIFLKQIANLCYKRRTNQRVPDLAYGGRR